MGLQAIANRYARALADVMIERKETDQVLDELYRFSALLAANPDVTAFFGSPVITVDQKRQVLGRILTDFKPRQTTSNFVQLLLENYRLHRLDFVLRSLERELDRRAGIVSANVTTARPIDAEEQNRLRDRLRQATGREVRLSFDTDASVIGGVITKIGSTVFDGSIRNQLTLVKEQLTRSK